MRPPAQQNDDHRRSAAAPIRANESILLGVILVFTAALYSATLFFGFVYDDNGQVIDNALVHSWRFVPQYFHGAVWQYLFPDSPANYYRPLNLLWFRLNDALFGMHPAGWHATTILLHVTATFLVYVLARRLSGKPFAAAFAALLFAVHPTRHEVVAWISGTTESLWAVLFLSAFLAYLKSREGYRVRWIMMSCGLYAAALLAKETAIMLPPIVITHAWIYGNCSSESRNITRRSRFLDTVRLASGYVLVAVAYMAGRIRVLHGFSHPQLSLPAATYAYTLPSVLFFYLKQWFFPIQMAEFYNVPMWFGFNATHVLLPAIGLLALAYAIWLWRRQLGSREVIFSSVWVLTLLLPALDIAVFPHGQLVHDRYLYVPSFGVCLLLGLAVERSANGPQVFGLPRKWLWVTLVLAALLSYEAAKAASYWASDYILFERAYLVNPQNTTVRTDYAIELARAGDYEKALPIMVGLAKAEPNNATANYNLGHFFYGLKMMGQAEEYLNRARILAPTMPGSYLELGLIDLKTNRLQDAEANMRQAAMLRPYEATYHFALGTVLVAQGKCDEARSELGKAFILSPNMPQAREQFEKCSKTGTSQSDSALPGRASAATLPAAANPR